eukprot:scaffold2394_cov276-Pinguiococcus_pyrenoidosus.AAC.1
MIQRLRPVGGRDESTCAAHRVVVLTSIVEVSPAQVLASHAHLRAPPPSRRNQHGIGRGRAGLAKRAAALVRESRWMIVERVEVLVLSATVQSVSVRMDGSRFVLEVIEFISSSHHLISVPEMISEDSSFRFCIIRTNTSDCCGLKPEDSTPPLFAAPKFFQILLEFRLRPILTHDDDDPANEVKDFEGHPVKILEKPATIHSVPLERNLEQLSCRAVVGPV